MIYTADTVPQDTMVYGFAYKFYGHDTSKLFVAAPTQGIVKNNKFYSNKDNFDPDNIFDGKEQDCSPAYIFKYADSFQEAVSAYNDLVCDRMEWLGELLKESGNDLYLEF